MNMACKVTAKCLNSEEVKQRYLEEARAKAKQTQGHEADEAGIGLKPNKLEKQNDL